MENTQKEKKKDSNWIQTSQNEKEIKKIADKNTISDASEINLVDDLDKLNIKDSIQNPKSENRTKNTDEKTKNGDMEEINLIKDLDKLGLKDSITETKKEKETQITGDEFQIPNAQEINLVKDLDKLGIEDNNQFEKKTWDTLGIPENIQKGLLDMGFLQPSKIQATSFSLIMNEPRQNIIAQSKNGSGKTAAFGIGIISSVDENNKNIQAVVFAHTRELVIQVKEVLEKIAKYTKVKITSPLSQDHHDDYDNAYGQIIVITPGHFENCFLRRGNEVLLDNLKILVLDEADYMLTNEVTSKVCEKSFKLFQRLKMNVQILFFSATFDERCKKIIKKYLTSQTHQIELKKEDLTLDKVKQLYQECKSQEDKIKFIEEYLPLNSNSQRVLIFANRRNNVINLQQTLAKRGYKVFILMGGDMAFSNRDETIKKFKNGEIQILISTDLLSRGYDER